MFKRFDMISAVSGAAWMSLQMGYSQSVSDMLDRMGDNPKSAGYIFNQDWTTRLIFGDHRNKPALLEARARAKAALDSGELPLCEPVISALQKLHDMLGSVDQTLDAATQVLFAVTGQFLYDWQVKSNMTDETANMLRTAGQYLELLLLAAHASGSNYLSWKTGIEWLMEQTGGITPDMTLNSPPAKWADGKDFLELSTIAASKVAEYVRLGVDTISYSDTTSPEFLPGIFSHKMGTSDEQALFPFCGSPSCATSRMTYTQGFKTKQGTETVGDFFAKNVDQVTGGLPISTVAAVASSMSYYYVPRTDYLKSLAADWCGLDVTMWAAGGGGAGDIFSKGQAMWRKSQDVSSPACLNTISRSNMMALFDGGRYLDTTGIMPAVAAGATYVSAWMDWYANELDMAFWELFRSQNASKNTRPWLFESPTREQAMDWLLGPSTPTIKPTQKTLYLDSIVFNDSPLSCVTAEVPDWGIKAGSQVTLSALAVNTNGVSTGFSTPFLVYGDLVQELTTALMDPSNIALTERLQRLVVQG